MLTTAIVSLLLRPYTVTFEGRPDRLERVLSAISQTSGVKLACAEDLKDEVVVIRVRDVDMDDLLQRIAKIEDGEWKVQADQTRILKRSDALVKARLKRELAARMASIASEFRRVAESAKQHAMPLEKLTDAVEKMTAATLGHSGSGEPPSGVDNMGAVWEAMPAVIALEEIIGQAPAEEWAQLPDNRTIVYSNSPNQWQRPFKSTWDAAVRKAIQTQNAVAKKVGPSALITDRGRLRTIDPGARATLDVTRHPDGSYYVNLRIRDTAGGVAPVFTEYLYTRDGVEGGSVKTPQDIGQRPLKFSNATKEFLVAIGATGERETRPRSQEMLRRYVPSKTVEPLTFSYAEGLSALTQDWPVQVVAAVPEEIFRPRQQITTDISIQTYLDQIRRQFLALTLDDSWLMGEITTSQRARLADRQVLAKWGESALRLRTPTIEEQVAHAANPRVAGSPLVADVMSFLWPNSPFNAESLKVNRLLALLGAPVWNAVFAGREVSVGGLPAATIQALADETLFGELRNLRITDPNRSNDEVLPDGTRIPKELSPLTSFDLEPTELFANGIPRAAVIGGYVRKDQLGTSRGGQLEPWALFSLKEGDTVFWKRTAQRLAFMLLGHDSVPIEDLENKKFGFGNTSTGTVNISYLPNVRAEFTVSLQDIDLSKRAGLNEGPDNFRNVLNRWLEYYRQNPPPP